MAASYASEQLAQPPHSSSTNKEYVGQFWSIFRSLCNSFQKRIDTLLLTDAAADCPSLKDWDEEMRNKLRAYYATSSRRNEGRLELDGILKEVRLLQHKVLSSSSSLAVDSSSNSNEALCKLLLQPMPDLALTDIRLITAEMEKILTRIDEARDMISPKEKFVFRRYRKALDELNRNGGGEITNTLDSLKIDSKEQKQQVEEQQPKQSTELNFGGVVENKSDSIIEIQSDGSINQIENEHPHEHWKTYTAPSESVTTTGASSYLLQNISNSTIIIHPTLQSLHIQNIQNCKVHSSVHGPVHVTNCHNSEVRCSAYQLRVHDSKNVDFGVWVRSGPIIEDCTGMVFAGNFYTNTSQPGRNMYWDVKDFKWLRSLRKSPNFTVIEDNAQKAVVLGVVESDVQNEAGANHAEIDDDSEDEL